MHVAVEDVIDAVCDEELAKHIIETPDQLDDIIDAAVVGNAHGSSKLSCAQPDTAPPRALRMTVDQFSMMQWSTLMLVQVTSLRVGQFLR